MAGYGECWQELKIPLYTHWRTIDSKSSRNRWTDLDNLFETVGAVTCRDRAGQSKSALPVTYGATKTIRSKGSEISEHDQRFEKTSLPSAICTEHHIYCSTEIKTGVREIPKGMYREIDQFHGGCPVLVGFRLESEGPSSITAEPGYGGHNDDHPKEGNHSRIGMRT
jgi:hypothetical protein